MSRGSSQSRRGRAARSSRPPSGDARGVTTRGVGDPSGSRLAPVPAGSLPVRARKQRPLSPAPVAGGAALRGGGGGGAVSALSWGRGAPSRAGEEAGGRARYSPRLRPDHAPRTPSVFALLWGSPPYIGLLVTWPRVRGFDPNRKLWFVGCAQPHGSVGAASGSRVGRRAADRRAPSGPGKAGSRQTRVCRWRSHRHGQRPRPGPCPAPQAGKGHASGQPAPGWPAPPIPPRRGERAHAASQGRPDAQGHPVRGPGQVPEGEPPASQVSRNRAQPQRAEPRLRATQVDFSTSESSSPARLQRARAAAFPDPPAETCQPQSRAQTAH